MNVTQVACAVTAFALAGLRGLVIELWVNVLVVAIMSVRARRRPAPNFVRWL